MSASRAASDDSRLEEIAKTNPSVDAEKVREAQTVIEELRRGGVFGPSYDIVSPYERKPVERAESSNPYERQPV